ncbi:hypothetical protein [Micromonospora sp. NBC_00421]
MTGRVVHLDDRREPQKRRDNQVIEVFENVTDWPTAATTSSTDKRGNSRR